MGSRWPRGFTAGRMCRAGNGCLRVASPRLPGPFSPALGCGPGRRVACIPGSAAQGPISGAGPAPGWLSPMGSSGPQWELETSRSGREGLNPRLRKGGGTTPRCPGGAARLRPSVGLAGAHASGAAQGCRVRRRSGSGRQSRRWRGRASDRRGVSHGASPSHGVAPLSRASPGPREQRRWPLSSSPREVPEAGTHKGLTALVPLPPRPLVSPFLPFIMYFNRVGARRMALIMGGGARPPAHPPALGAWTEGAAGRRRHS